jgi:uncharacterized protein YecE (DUF72 family)
VGAASRGAHLFGVRWHIGTSGWHYPHWRGRFYPGAPNLPFYASRFACVELNGTFYRLPSPATVEAWHAATPPDFRFAWKASRYLTHMKRLRDPDEPLARMAAAMAPLREKLGPVLFQLPPSFPRDVPRLREFLRRLPWRVAVEFRDTDWHHPEVYDALREHGAAFVAYELAGVRSPLVATADFAYVRLHGPGGKYRGRYGRDGVRAWADAVGRLDVGEAWVFFDNDERAYAVEDAREMAELFVPA